MKDLIKSTGIVMISCVFRVLPMRVRMAVVDMCVNALRYGLPAADALRALFDLENRLYVMESEESIRYGRGVHTKHTHICYDAFFAKHIQDGERVLDIGSNTGELTRRLATVRPLSTFIGVELDEGRVLTARSLTQMSNVEFLSGDVTQELPENEFDVVVLSNVLEHIENRVGLLTHIQAQYNPIRILIRVPLFERDWRVPLKQELGVEHRLSIHHYIEYTQESFLDELHSADFCVEHCEVRWGELWCVARRCHD